jgi:hypothetical protein
MVGRRAVSKRSLQDYRLFAEDGERLGRDGMAKRAIEAVAEWQRAGSTFKGAMILAGRLKAVAMMASRDDYWREQVEKGLQIERGKSRVGLPAPSIARSA